MRQRIVIVNPNSTAAVTEGISAAVAPLRAAQGPEIDCVTLEEGPPGIETQAQIDAVVPPLLARLKREAADASVIACFSDPGLQAARAETGRPVFGIAESGFRKALTLRPRFGILAILEASSVRHRRYVAALGLSESFAGSLPLDLGVLELQDRDRTFGRMVDVGRALRDDKGAEVLVLGCAGMPQYRDDLAEELGLPVVEPCRTAAEAALAALQSAGAAAP
ncbi:aspartate/glutamate racemase family protein [Pelagibius sp. CAU 1746]|uniref:aspartate/glutamate racemase family protein n=1 Tax=Pelagibius sp. CAU 1746 TaxID=3140370 RepID=UPI00325B998F